MKLLANAVISVSRFMGVVAVIALTAMGALTLADVALRAISRPIPGAYELVGILGAIVIGFSIPYTSLAKGHVVMDFLIGRLSGHARTALHMLTRILAIVFFIIAGWNLCVLGEAYSKAGEVTLTLKLPLYPVFYVVGFCCFVECLVLFVDMMDLGQGSKQ